MGFRTHENGMKCIDYGNFDTQTTLNIAYDDLCLIFGNPIIVDLGDEDCDRQLCEWDITFDNGVEVVIRNPSPLRDRLYWHCMNWQVRGAASSAAEQVVSAISDHFERKANAVRMKLSEAYRFG